MFHQGAASHHLPLSLSDNVNANIHYKKLHFYGLHHILQVPSVDGVDNGLEHYVRSINSNNSKVSLKYIGIPHVSKAVLWQTSKWTVITGQSEKGIQRLTEIIIVSVQHQLSFMRKKAFREHSSVSFIFNSAKVYDNKHKSSVEQKRQA